MVPLTKMFWIGDWLGEIVMALTRASPESDTVSINPDTHWPVYICKALGTVLSDAFHALPLKEMFDTGAHRLLTMMVPVLESPEINTDATSEKVRLKN